MKKPKGGYVAISRSIFDHPLFQSAKPLSWREAWEWLIGAAAWQARGERNKHGVFDLSRAQLAMTERELAGAWRWPKTNVHRYLRRLATEGMIGIEQGRCGPKNGAQNGAKGYARTFVTVLNYNKFQLAHLRADQKPDQKADQKYLPLPELAAESASATKQTYKPLEFKKEAAERFVNRPKPFHGARDGKGNVWWDHGTWEWNTYAADFESVKGAVIFPVRYIGGRGRWFAEMGELARLAKSRKSG